MERGQERLQRTLARAGFGSRRACEELISAGRVTIDGVPAILGSRVVGEQEVRVDGHAVNLDPDARYYVLHKPAGVITTMSDPQGRPDITEFLPAAGPRVFPVGRLDKDTEGLLILTNDGELANRLTHPSFGIEKEYLAEVEGQASDKQLARVRAGVDLEDGPARAAAVRTVGRAGERTALRVIMTEGRKREVRRLFAAVGLPVVRLIRLRVGPVLLADLPPGQLRELEHDDLRALYEAAGL